ncbi:hypothetical protein MTO96_045108, partial [Rhipicephalus appendiculatus]
AAPVSEINFFKPKVGAPVPQPTPRAQQDVPRWTDEQVRSFCSQLMSNAPTTLLLTSVSDSEATDSAPETADHCPEPPTKQRKVSATFPLGDIYKDDNLETAKDIKLSAAQCVGDLDLGSSQVQLGGSQGQFDDPSNELGGSQWEQDRSGDQTIIGSRRDDGKIYAGCGRWVDKDAWGMLMKAPSDSMFCRFACLIYWTPEQLKCRSVTGVLSNKYKSFGQTQAKPAMTPEKPNSLKACLTTTTKNQEEATLNNVEKAAMTWFRHAAEGAAAGHRRPPTSSDDEGGI